MSTPKVEVVVRRPGHPERRIAFGAGVAHMGRAEDNDIVLTDIGVSRRHARIVIQDASVVIEDLGSGNGTYFQGNRVNRQAIRDGDEFFIDPFRLFFEIAEAGLADQPELTGDLEEVDDDDTAELPLESSGLPAVPISAEAQVRLVTLQGQRLAPSYPVRSGGLTIGRSEARDVILFDPAASRNHAELEFVGGDVWFRDQGSGNGSFVNGHRVREQCLRNGDRVRIGSTEFRLEVLDAARREPPTLPPSPVRRRRGGERGLAERPTDLRAEVPPALVSRKPNVVALAALAGFGLVLMMIVGGLLVLYVVERPGFGPGAGGQQMTAAEVALEPDQVRALAEYMDSGKQLFDEGDFLAAATKFYTALNVLPNHPEAERMGAVACEYVMLDELKKGLRLRTLSEADQQKKLRDALSLANRAVRASSSVEEKTVARTALLEVEVFSPDDDRVRSLLEQLKSR